MIAMDAGADFIKTSTGKVNISATPEAAYVMCRAISDFYAETGIRVGFKPAGGIVTAADAFTYYQIVSYCLGNECLIINTSGLEQAALQIIFFPKLPESDMITFKQEQTIVAGDSVRQKSDTSLQNLSIPSDSGRIVDSIPHKNISIPDAIETQEPVDTTSVCTRNSISDVTFYDSLNIITRIDQTYSGQFPFLFTEKTGSGNQKPGRNNLCFLKMGKRYLPNLFTTTGL